MKFKVIFIIGYIGTCGSSFAESELYGCSDHHTNFVKKEDAGKCISNIKSEFKLKPKTAPNEFDYLEQGKKLSDTPRKEVEGTPEYKYKNEQLLKNFYKNISKNKINIALPLIYSYADKFSEGLAAVSFGQIKYSDLDSSKAAWKTGYIDKAGKLVIAPYYDTADNFLNGIGAVKIANSEKVTEIYLNRQGKELFSKEYDTIKNKDTGKGTGVYLNTGGFNEGLKAVYQINKGEYKYGFVDAFGQLVIPYEYDFASRFSEGLALVGKKIEINGVKKIQYGFIDKFQKQVVGYKFDALSDFSNGLATYANKPFALGSLVTDGRFGLINKNGEIVVKAQFLNQPIFSEGMAGVCIGEYLSNEKSVCGVIDATGNFIIPPIFKVHPYATYADIHILTFHEGLASYCEDKAGRTKYGFINKAGEKVISAKYDYVGRFSDGLAPVVVKINNDYYSSKTGYINLKGKMVIPAVFEDARDFNEGYAPVRVGDRWGYIKHP